MKQTNTNTIEATATYQTNEDFKNSVLIVSVLINLTVLITWLVAHMSSSYTAQLIGLL